VSRSSQCAVIFCDSYQHVSDTNDWLDAPSDLDEILRSSSSKKLLAVYGYVTTVSSRIDTLTRFSASQGIVEIEYGW
jgi:hypothetical protein